MASSDSGGGFGFFTVVGIVLVTLKLVGTIDWSWWWVLAPFWLPFGFLLVVFLIAVLGIIAEKIIDR